MYDSIVIGYGPAGISASIYLKRFNNNVLVIGKDSGALTNAHIIDNFYGSYHKAGKDIVLDGIKQATSLGVLVCHDEVIAIEYGVEGFIVKTKKQEYATKTIMLATGKVRNSFNIAKKFEGKGISYCASCDGFFYRNKKLAMIGYNDYMKTELEHLKQITSDITIFTNNNPLEVDVEGLTVINDEIADFYGEENLEGITLKNGVKYDFDGVFIALGSQNAFTLAKHLGLEVNNNNLVVDEQMMTNIPGIFAGGDVIGPIYQIAKASCDGMKAGYAMNDFLKKNK